MFQNTDGSEGISKHRLSPYTSTIYILQTLHSSRLFNVSGSNCNLIFVLKPFSVVHCMQLSGNTLHLSTYILFEKFYDVSRILNYMTQILKLIKKTTMDNHTHTT